MTGGLSGADAAGQPSAAVDRGSKRGRLASIPIYQLALFFVIP